MNKLHLHIDENIQGDFKIQDLNLLLVFQVNCPGCFHYALPTFNRLYETFAQKLGFLAVSTAFEDFELNNTRNTKKLIDDGELVGETKKSLLEQGINKLPYPLHFPVAMDKKLTHEDTPELVEKICRLNPNFVIWSPYDQNLMRKNVMNYVIQQDEISLTFTANQFKGTPTFALFNEQYDLLDSWFGHTDVNEIISKVRSLMN